AVFQLLQCVLDQIDSFRPHYPGSDFQYRLMDIQLVAVLLEGVELAVLDHPADIGQHLKVSLVPRFEVIRVGNRPGGRSCASIAEFTKSVRWILVTPLINPTTV